jgi:hypothetical protein
MRRLLLISLATCVLITTSILSASAMPVAKPNMLADSDGIVLVKGGHGHGHGHGHMGRGGRGTTTVGAEAAGIIMVGTGAAITDGIRCIDMLRPPRRGGLIGYRVLFSEN